MRITIISTILLICTFACIDQVKAQGTLQFNQVILYEIQGGSMQTFTVPAGKIWKVESVTRNSGDIHLRNASLTYLGALNSSAGNHRLPYWIPENYNGNFYNTGSVTSHGSVSIIEFNVVP